MTKSEFLLYLPIYKTNAPQHAAELDAYAADERVCFIVIDEGDTEGASLYAVNSNMSVVFDGASHRVLIGKTASVLSEMVGHREKVQDDYEASRHDTLEKKLPQLVEAGFSPNGIADLYGVSEATVTRMISRLSDQPTSFTDSILTRVFTKKGN